MGTAKPSPDITTRIHMARSMLAGLLISVLASCTPRSVTNPNLLVPPVQLTRAEGYLDGGSLGGTLVDSQGRHLDFFFGLGFEDRGEPIYLGFISEGLPKQGMLARFDGWKAEDLYALIERTIHEQFVWDATTQRLRAKAPLPKLESDPYDGRFMHVGALLRYMERKLHRKDTYLQPARRSGTLPLTPLPDAVPRHPHRSIPPAKDAQ